LVEKTERKVYSYSLFALLEEITRSYCGDPVLLVELREFIEVLDDTDRTIIYLKYLGFNAREIARELGVTKRRIRQRLKRIRELAGMWIG